MCLRSGARAGAGAESAADGRDACVGAKARGAHPVPRPPLPGRPDTHARSRSRPHPTPPLPERGGQSDVQDAVGGSMGDDVDELAGDFHEDDQPAQRKVKDEL